MRDDPRRREPAAYPFAATLEMRFGDMDVWRHLNNVAAVRLYEEGRIRFMAHLRDANPDFAAQHFRLMVAHAAVDYLAEGQYPHPIAVGVGVASIGNRSYRVGHALFQQDRCIGLADVVLTHIADAGAAPLPPVMRATLERYLLSPLPAGERVG
jgi:acyl-CoA thioester hydrolase